MMHPRADCSDCEGTRDNVASRNWQVQLRPVATHSKSCVQQADEEMSPNLLTLMLNPALALVSMNMTLNSRALASPSSMETCLRPCHE